MHHYYPKNSRLEGCFQLMMNFYSNLKFWQNLEHHEMPKHHYSDNKIRYYINKNFCLIEDHPFVDNTKY